MNAAPHRGFRLTLWLLTVLLTVQSVWLAVPGVLSAGINQLPIAAPAAIAAAQKRVRAGWAASIGAIRGQLWAQFAFTYADLLWGALSVQRDNDLMEARAALDHALVDAPHQSGAWLMLAGLGLRYPFRNFDMNAALKMSYYTGPSEPELIPLRLRFAVQSQSSNDIELRDFIARDLRVLLSHQQKTAVVDAYNAASAPEKQFIEQTIAAIDPAAVQTLHASTPKPDLPD